MAPLSGSFERGMEQVAQGVKRNIKQQATATVQATKSQVVPQKADVGTGEQGTVSNQQAVNPIDQTQAIEQAPLSGAIQQKHTGQKQPSAFYQRQIAKGKTPEESASLEKIRNELHKQYFEDLTNRPKPKEEVVTVQKSEEMTALQEEKEKKKLPPLPVMRKQRRIENLPGSG